MTERHRENVDTASYQKQSRAVLYSSQKQIIMEEPRGNTVDLWSKPNA